MSKNDEYLIGESIWDTYRSMAYLIGEERRGYYETLPTEVARVPRRDGESASINPRRRATRGRSAAGRSVPLRQRRAARAEYLRQLQQDDHDAPMPGPRQ